MRACYFFPPPPWSWMRTYHPRLTSSYDSLTIKAFTCVLIVLTSYLAIRTMYRTIRQTLSLVSFMIRWGLVLYFFFFLWLWWTEGKEQSGLHQSLAATHSMIHSKCDIRLTQTPASPLQRIYGNYPSSLIHGSALFDMLHLFYIHPSPKIVGRPNGGALASQKKILPSSSMPLAGTSGSNRSSILQSRQSDGTLCQQDGGKNVTDLVNEARSSHNLGGDSNDVPVSHVAPRGI